MRLNKNHFLPLIALGIWAGGLSARSTSEHSMNGQYSVPTPECAVLLNSADSSQDVRIQSGSTLSLVAEVHELKITVKDAAKGSSQLILPIGKFPLQGEAGARGQTLHNRYGGWGLVFESSVENLLPDEHYPIFQLIRGPDALHVDLNWGERHCDLQPL